jgi:hypothetical protein
VERRHCLTELAFTESRDHAGSRSSNLPGHEFDSLLLNGFESAVITTVNRNANGVRTIVVMVSNYNYLVVGAFSMEYIWEDSSRQAFEKKRAGDGDRTRDVQLGKMGDN